VWLIRRHTTSEDFLGNTVSQDWLSAFAMLSAEKVMTEKMIIFNNKVTANCKERRMDFTYK
jgi:hypothetical protein